MRHSSRLLAALLAVPFILAALVGCDDGCPEGQQQVQTGSIPMVTMVGKVPVTNNVPVYECR